MYEAVWIGDPPDGFLAAPGDVIEISDLLGARYCAAGYAMEEADHEGTEKGTRCLLEQAERGRR